ncbi:MmpS family transport accessory protein [Streptomyces sp. NPDC003023]|uniref:MmpS family transport accessory protein n=1 Tax=Streptomyces sp. NPDC003023 TaxID=3364675 RepID=UPI0036B7DD55
MKRSTRTALRGAMAAGLVAALALALGACSDDVVEQVDQAVDETYEVTYEVTGSSVESIQFHGGGGDALNPRTETVEGPTLPWRKTVTLRGIMPAAVMPVAADPAGAEVVCRITHKGKVLAEENGEGLVTSGGCVAESPVGG